MNFQNAAIGYALCALLALGHWFANEYDSSGNMNTVGNPASGMIVSMFWPSYVSYLFFKE